MSLVKRKRNQRCSERQGSPSAWPWQGMSHHSFSVFCPLSLKRVADANTRLLFTP